LQRVLVYKKDETARALALLEEQGVEPNPDPEYGDSGVFWIHENSDVRPALKFQREQNILANEYRL
jgi:hypothetical protein